MANGKFTDPLSGDPQRADDDPYAELFADCKTVEDVLQLQRDIEEAESAQGQ